jgi:peptidyl-tRNA hydrolase
VIDWVLEPFSAEEESLVLPDLLDRAADAVEMTIREGLSKAMGQFNQIS